MHIGTQISNPASTVTAPVHDWHQLKETLTLLCLASAQIRNTVKDSAVDIDQLTTTFTNIAKDSTVIKAACHRLEAEKHPLHNTDIQTLIDSASTLLAHVNQTVVFFQFHDRLNQKLDHITHSLSDLSALIGDPNAADNPDDWQHIQNEIRASYSMECERMMFDYILQGTSIEEALTLYQHHFDHPPTAEEANSKDDIELF